MIESGATETVVPELRGHIGEDVIAIYTHVPRGVNHQTVAKAFAPNSRSEAKEEAKVAQNTPVSEAKRSFLTGSF